MAQTYQEAYDVAIVGGGLAGVSMAQALRGCPARIALIDAHDIAHPDTLHPPYRAIALSDSSQRIFKTLGIWDDIAKHAQAVERVWVSEKNAFGVTNINTKGEDLHRIGSAISNTDLLQSLYRANDLAEHVDLFPCHSVCEVRRDQDSVRITLQDEDKSFELQARLLILSSGGDFSLASSLGFQQRIINYRQTAMVCTVEVAEPYDGTVYDRFADGQLLVLLPCKESKRRALVWVMRDAEHTRIKDYPDTELMDLAQAKLGDCATIQAKHSDFFSYPLSGAYCEEPASGRVLLLGDAAHKLHPIAAQGLNLSLRDVAFAAELIERHQDTGSAEMLKAYCDLRTTDARRTMRFTDSLARIIVNPSPGLSVARGMSLASLNMLPWLRRRIVRSSLGLAPPHSRLASGIPLWQ